MIAMPIFKTCPFPASEQIEARHGTSGAVDKIYPLDISEFTRPAQHAFRVSSDEDDAMRWLDREEVSSPHWALLVKRMLKDRREQAIRDCIATVRVNAITHRSGTFSAPASALNEAAKDQLDLCLEGLQSLLQPKTKEVEVWHVEAFRHQDNIPTISGHTTKEDADKTAWSLTHEQKAPNHFSCVRVTGPYKHTVPAD